jgi:hypothetical protein
MASPARPDPLMAEPVTRAQLHFTYADLAEALQLPDGAVITSVEDDRKSRTVSVLILGAGDPAPDGREPKLIPTQRPPDSTT